MLGPKTRALLAETGQPLPATVIDPVAGQRYRADHLPAGAVVKFPGTGVEYVRGRAGMCMRWEQPIHGSGEWLVEFVRQLPDGVWLTDRELREIEQARGPASDAEAMAALEKIQSILSTDMLTNDEKLKSIREMVA